MKDQHNHCFLITTFTILSINAPTIRINRWIQIAIDTPNHWVSLSRNPALLQQIALNCPWIKPITITARNCRHVSSIWLDFHWIRALKSAGQQVHNIVVHSPHQPINQCQSNLRLRILSRKQSLANHKANNLPWFPDLRPLPLKQCYWVDWTGLSPEYGPASSPFWNHSSIFEIFNPKYLPHSVLFSFAHTHLSEFCSTDRRRRER